MRQELMPGMHNAPTLISDIYDSLNLVGYSVGDTLNIAWDAKMKEINYNSDTSQKYSNSVRRKMFQ